MATIKTSDYVQHAIASAQATVKAVGSNVYSMQNSADSFGKYQSKMTQSMEVAHTSW